MNDVIFTSHFVTTFAQLEPLALMEDMNDSFISSIHARKTVHIFKSFTSSICAKNRSLPQRVHILGPCQANHAYLQAFTPASAAIIVFTSSMRSYLPSMPNIALTPTNHSKPLCTTKMWLIGQKRVSGTLLIPIHAIRLRSTSIEAHLAISLRDL